MAGSGLFLRAGSHLGLAQLSTPSASKSATRALGSPLGYSLQDVAREAHLDFLQVCGGDTSKKYILETTGSGVAFIDYDNDGWLDIFLVNGSSFELSASQDQPTNKLFHNNRDGTFTDVTTKAGLTRSGWGQGVCVGDYDNDGFDDIFVTYWGEDVLYHNNGDGTFTEVGRKAKVAGEPGRWSTGCAFLDYDRDGKLDLFVTHYVNFSLQNALDPGTNPYCMFRGLAVNCGPRGLIGETSTLYHNNGDGTFTDVSAQAGILKQSGFYGLGVLVADFDNDGWPDIYMASDTTPALLGFFALCGLLMAVIGLYGVIAFMAAQRTQEIGVRMALGATRMDILRLIAGEGVRLIVLGGVVGLGAALAAAQLLKSLLFHVGTHDPVSFIAVTLLLALVALAATLIPARAAMNTDPMNALRVE